MGICLAVNSIATTDPKFEEISGPSNPKTQ